MINIGYNITGSADPLRRCKVADLARSIAQPKPAFEITIKSLRTAYTIDRARYNTMKKTLPYIVCAHFNPAIRRGENFVYTEHLLLDIDHISEKGKDIENLRGKLRNDKRVALLFASPSGDGLKVMFKLAERCTDKGLYQLFYKRFAQSFASAYGIEQVVDRVTSDVTRACFVSHDPTVYYNAEAEPLNIKDYCDAEQDFSLLCSNDMRDLLKPQKPIKSTETKQTDIDNTETQPEKKNTDPEGDELRKIKEILKIRLAQTEKQKPPVYVPRQLDEIIDELRQYIEENGMKVTEVINISYGKKIRLALGIKQAEVNVFFGKRGFTVVQSPRCGTNPELNQIAADFITAFFE